MDLWARDLEVQVEWVDRLILICPVVEAAPASWGALAPLPKGVEVVPETELKGEREAEVIAECDVVQLPGNQGWFDGRASRRLLRAAGRGRVKSIVGISSNRARTALLNARSGSPVSRLKGLLKYVGIRLNQRYLTRFADGAFVVGEGLRPLVSPRCKSLHVGVASWIRQADLAAAEGLVERPGALAGGLCAASRLEPMKGVHLAIEALAMLSADAQAAAPRLTILGAGPELEPLRKLAETRRVADRVVFGGVLPYPDEFLGELRTHPCVLLTNLNDEQPRLIFDAISQGCVPICPRASAYEALELPTELLYRQGDAADLAQTLRRLDAEPERLPAIRKRLLEIGRRFTLESMHKERAAWIETEILGLRAPRLDNRLEAPQSAAEVLAAG